MVIEDGLMRIFWPSEAQYAERRGVLLGWRNSASDVFIGSILYDVDVRAVENGLKLGLLYTGSPHPIDHLLERCGPSPLQVLGVVHSGKSNVYEDGHVVAKMVSPYSLPQILWPAAPGMNIQVILYSRPKPQQMQFMSPHPISLAIADKGHRSGLEVPPFASIDAAEKIEEQHQNELIKKLKLHTVKRYPSTDKELALNTIIRQINCSYDIDAVVQKNVHLIRAPRRRGFSMGERVVESASNLWDLVRATMYHIFKGYVWPVITRSFAYTLIAQRLLAEAVVLASQTPIGPHKIALRDVSATAQQIDLRLQQFCYWPIQYLTLQRRKGDWESISNSPAEYIRFYNSLWLVANDIIIGIAVGSYIMENADLLAGYTDILIGEWSLRGLRRLLAWLMVYPAGLKLNNELAGFLGDLFIWVIDYWGACVATLRPHFPTVIRIIGTSALAGMTLPLSLASDLLSLCTLHIHCFYIAAARLYGWQLTIIGSLFHLFRGKKRNVLRHRIDSCDYELDQLLLGTILFTLLFFLLPTVMVFYITFALARLGIILGKGVLDGLLACLNHFPLFALMLRVKDPWRLPGGIRFDLQPLAPTSRPSPPAGAQSNSPPAPPTTYITLRSTPLPLSAMFHEYASLASHIQRHYLSPQIGARLATGGMVPPLHRKNLYALQYSSLPARRVGVRELWIRLGLGAPTSAVSNSARAANGSAVPPQTAKGSGGAGKGTGGKRAGNGSLTRRG